MNEQNLARKTGIKRIIPIVIAGLLVLCVSVVLWYFPKEFANDINHPEGLDPVEAGVWDLTEFDLNEYNIFVRGPMEYVMGALLTPEEFQNYEGEILQGWPPEAADQVVTVRLTLYMPEDKVYSMVSTSAEYSERIYVNGVWRHDVGTPGLTAEESVASSGYKRIDVVPEDGVVEIVRQSSNFVHKEGGGYSGYYVGSTDNIARMMDIEKLFAAFTVGLYLCLFLLHMVLFLVVRGYHANLWFALICLAWLLRAGFTGRFIYWAMFPGIPWTLTYKLGCVSIALTGIFLLLLVRDEFPGVVQRWPLRIFTAIQAGLAVFYVVADTVTDSHIKLASEVLLYIAAGYLAVRLIMWLPKTIRKKKLLLEQAITLAGLAVAVFTLLHDAMRYNGWMPGIVHYELGEVGMLALVLFQMVAMMLGTMRQLTVARQNEQIAFESAEIARKNEKLALLRAESAETDLELHKQIIASIPIESLITCGPFVLDTTKGQAFLKDEDMQLSPKEFALLRYFIPRKNENVDRTALYEAVWNQSYVSTDRALASNLYRLRKKLIGSDYVISNVRGIGYRFEKEW